MIKRILNKIYRVYINRKYNSPYSIAEDFLDDYKKHRYSKLKIHKIHKRGFTVDDWRLMDLNEDNYKCYLSSVDYASLHPINGSFGKWIDDKLTLKYLCSGTTLDRYMPRYYFLVDGQGSIVPLIDLNSDHIISSSSEVCELLKKEQVLAFKQIAGSLGEGFYKLEYKDSKYYANGKEYSEKGFSSFLSNMKNYIIMEYLSPCEEIAKYSAGTANTLRYLAANDNGNIIKIVSFIRIGTVASNFVENYAAGGVLCYIDDDGLVHEGNVIDQKTFKNTKIHEHPDNGLKLEFAIPMWNEIKEAVNEIYRVLPMMRYQGVDFVITDKNELKILEINSLPSLDALQLEEPLFETEKGKFYKNLLKK